MIEHNENRGGYFHILKRSRSHIRVRAYLCAVGVLIYMTGCSSTTRVVHSADPVAPLCRTLAAESHEALEDQMVRIVWRSQWRTNQKEVTKREEILEHSLTRFFDTDFCLPVRSIERATDYDLFDIIRKWTADSDGQSDVLILITIQEMGPRLICLPSPILWVGQTHVAFQMQILGKETIRNQSPTHRTLFEGRLEQQTGGPFQLRSTDWIQPELERALRYLFYGRE